MTVCDWLIFGLIAAGALVEVLGIFLSDAAPWNREPFGPFTVTDLSDYLARQIATTPRKRLATWTRVLDDQPHVFLAYRYEKGHRVVIDDDVVMFQVWRLLFWTTKRQDENRLAAARLRAAIESRLGTSQQTNLSRLPEIRETGKVVFLRSRK